MKNQSLKARILESAVCTAVALTILCIAAGCGGSSSNPITNIIDAGSKAVARISSHPRSHASIHPGSGSGGNFISAMFFATPPASQLPESFEGTCDITGLSPLVGFTVLDVQGGVPCGPSARATGGIGGFGNIGIPVAFSGTITVLKVSVITLNNQRVRCIVQDGSSPVNDNDLVQPYYDFTTNTAVLGVGTTQLPISCVVPVAAGDQALKITMDWSKI